MRMADAQASHAEKMANGELEYSGKLLEARQSDWKDEFVLIVLTLPILVIAYGVFSDDPTASAKIKEFFEQFQQLPSWFTNLWILVVASIYGIKGTEMTIAAFDANLIKNYQEPKYLLHFQWNDGTEKIYRYALVETIDQTDIDHKSKQKQDETNLTQKQIWLKKYSYNNTAKR
jgi:hypothetical protein